jgi:phosphatidylserine/phosphatidylglycerophosphate/cardiolipin synthase-like enzyme
VQQARVELLRAVVLDERIALRIDPPLAYVGVDPRAQLAPVLERPGSAEVLGHLDRPVDRNPRHDLRVGEEAPPSPDLPDAFIGHLPDALEMRHERTLHVPRGVASRQPALARLVEDVHDLAVDPRSPRARPPDRSLSGRRDATADAPARGCRVWAGLGPFDHSKLMVLDGARALVGSANWDTRSLRLNFELDLECYGGGLAPALESLLLEKRANSREVTLAEVDARPLPAKLRDGAARLLAPYL